MVGMGFIAKVVERSYNIRVEEWGLGAWVVERTGVRLLLISVCLVYAACLHIISAICGRQF